MSGTIGWIITSAVASAAGAIIVCRRCGRRRRARQVTRRRGGTCWGMRASTAGDGETGDQRWSPVLGTARKISRCQPPDPDAGFSSPLTRFRGACGRFPMRHRSTAATATDKSARTGADHFIAESATASQSPQWWVGDVPLVRTKSPVHCDREKPTGYMMCRTMIDGDIL